MSSVTKGLAWIASVILTLVFIACIILATYGFQAGMDIAQITTLAYPQLTGIVQRSLNVACIITILILSIAIADCLGVFIKSQIFLIFALIGGLTISVLFIAIAARTVPLNTELLGTSCTQKSYSVNLQKVSDSAGDLLCKGCPCYFPALANYSDEDRAALTASLSLINPLSNITRVQECTSLPGPMINWNSSLAEGGDSFMSTLQTKFSCSGWCDQSVPLYYRFSNINRGKPTSNCFSQLNATSSSFLRGVYVSGFVLGFVQLLCWVFITIYFVQRCIEEKKEQRHQQEEREVSTSKLQIDNDKLR